MSQYSIEQFSKITGLNKILIRTWENRYNFLKPKRTTTNIRYYDDDMLTKGIKYAILANNGYKISKIIKYKESVIDELIEDLLKLSEKTDVKYTIYISKFIKSAIFFDQKEFERNYDKCLKDLGINLFYKEILIRTMNQLSILFLNTKITPANEHFLSENIRIKLSHEIAKTNSTFKNKKEWILFLPENEYHDISLLYTHLLLKIENQKVIYLGQNTPRESLLKFNTVSKNILFFINARTGKDFKNDLCLFLNKNMKNSNIYMIEKEGQLNTKYDNINILSNIDDLLTLLN